MKKLTTLLSTIVALATLTFSGGIALAASASQCTSKMPIKNIAPGSIQTVNVSNTKVTVGPGAMATVNGNGNCIVAGSGVSLHVNGSNNYVSGSHSNVYMRGSNNLFQSSQGGNTVDCGGSKASLMSTDTSSHCVLI